MVFERQAYPSLFRFFSTDIRISSALRLSIWTCSAAFIVHHQHRKAQCSNVGCVGFIGDGFSDCKTIVLFIFPKRIWMEILHLEQGINHETIACINCVLHF